VRLAKVRKPKNAIAVYTRKTYGFNTHALRYAFITHLLKKGVSPSIIARITGHASLDYILHYTELKTAEDILASAL
jgi:site-specific recombinase XerD